MKSKRSPQDEKLINDLYEKLNWFTFRASEEEFDAEQVRAILQLLDTLDPIPETEAAATSKEGNKRVPASDPDAAFDRFKKKYHITEEELAEKDAQNSDGGAGKILPFPAEFSAELAPCAEEAGEKLAGTDQTAGQSEFSHAVRTFGIAEAGGGINGTAIKPSGAAAGACMKRKRAGKNGRRHFFSGVAGKIAVGILVVAGATTFLSIGVGAVQQKSFFEIVRDGMNSMKITVTGNDMEAESQSEPALSLESGEKVYFDSWDAVKEENPDILVPGYIPEGLELEELYRHALVDQLCYIGNYGKNGMPDSMIIEIRSFEKRYSKRNLNTNLDWSLIENDGDVSYYWNGKDYLAIWQRQKGIYSVRWSNLDELKMVQEKME